MDFITNTIIGFVAILHISFLILEMFYWTKPLGLKVFGQSLEKAKASVTLAANQGLYNGFLATGLIWGLILTDPMMAKQIKLFFLSCVAIAGFYGGWTVNRKILFVQSGPAVVGLILLFLS